MLMIVLDGTIVNTALPVLKDSLDFSDGNLTWVLNAYLIPFGGLLMLSGRIGDLIGQRRMFLWGMSLFTFASLRAGREPGGPDRRAVPAGRRRRAGLVGDPRDDHHHVQGAA